MNNIIYIVGLVVVVIAVLSFFSAGAENQGRAQQFQYDLAFNKFWRLSRA